MGTHLQDKRTNGNLDVQVKLGVILRTEYRAAAVNEDVVFVTICGGDPMVPGEPSLQCRCSE